MAKIKLGDLRILISEAMKTADDANVANLALFVVSNKMLALYDSKSLIRELKFHAARPIMSPENSLDFCLTAAVVAAIQVEPEDGVLRVKHSYSSEKGYGYFLYNSVLALFGTPIIPDHTTSDAAKNVWKKYKDRIDVKVTTEKNKKGEDEVVMVEPASDFVGPGDLGLLTKRHKETMKLVLESPVVMKTGTKSIEGLESKFESKCFALLVSAVGGR